MVVVLETWYLNMCYNVDTPTGVSHFFDANLSSNIAPRENMAEYSVLMENEGRVHVVEVRDETVKYKGLGVINTAALLREPNSETRF